MHYDLLRIFTVRTKCEINPHLINMDPKWPASICDVRMDYITGLLKVISVWPSRIFFCSVVAQHDVCHPCNRIIYFFIIKWIPVLFNEKNDLLEHNLQAVLLLMSQQGGLQSHTGPGRLRCAACLIRQLFFDPWWALLVKIVFIK